MEYKHFFSYLTEGVEKYLIWEPTGIYKTISDEINKYSSSPNEMYRAASDKEIQILQKDKVFRSSGKGNTRANAGTYISSDIYLAGAFALRYFRDGNGGSIIILDRHKLPQITPRDPDNFTVEYIPNEAVQNIINLKSFVP